MLQKCFENPLGKPCSDSRQQLSYALLFTFLLGLIAHGMQFLSLAPTHDYLFSFFEREGEYRNALELGRYLQPVFRALTGTCAAIPWSIGLLSLLFIGLSVYGTAQIFEIKNKGLIFLLSGLMVTNQTVMATAGTYMTYLAPFSLALVLAVFAALCWKNFSQTGKWQYLPLGAMLIFLSAGLYQCYLFVTVAWILTDSILGLLQGRDGKKVICQGLMGAAMIAVGAALYFILLGPVEKLTGVGLKQDDYNSVTNAFRGTDFFLKGIVLCYQQFIMSFSSGFATVFSKYFLLAVHGLLFLMTGALGVRYLKAHKMKISHFLLMVLLLLLLPVATLGIVIFNGEMHDLMKYALCSIYLFPLILVTLEENEKLKEKAGTLLSLLLILVIFSNIQTANLIYTEKQLEFQGTVSIMTNVLSDIEDMEGYEPGKTQVYFAGYPQEIMPRLPYKEKIVGVAGCNEGSAITHPTKYGYFFRNILQRDVNVLMEEEFYPDCLPAPQYPAEGSIQWWNGMLVVNFRK